MSNDSTIRNTTSGPTTISEHDRLVVLRDMLMDADDKLFQSRRPGNGVLSDTAWEASLVASRLVFDAITKLEERIKELEA